MTTIRCMRYCAICREQHMLTLHIHPDYITVYCAIRSCNYDLPTFRRAAEFAAGF